MLYDLSLQKNRSLRWLICFFFPVDLWILKGRVSHWSGTILKVSVAFIIMTNKAEVNEIKQVFTPSLLLYGQILWGQLITSLNCQATYIALRAIHSLFNLLRRVPFQPPTSGPFGHGSPESAKTWAAALTWWSSWWSYARPYERGRHRNLWHWKRRSTLRTRHWGFYTRMIVMMAVVLFKKS